MKKLITFIAAGVFALSMAMTSFAGSWQRNNVGWWYQNDNGTWPAACWQQINGAWIPGGQPAAQTTQAIDYSALGKRYTYAYSIDAAGNHFQESRTDLYIRKGANDERIVTFDGQTWELYFHPRTNGRVFGRVYGQVPDIQIFYSKNEGKGDVELYVDGRSSYYTE